MKTPRVLSVLLFCLLLWPLIAPSARGTAAPRMILPEEAFDFREVFQGMTISHAFKVLNRGDEPLVIRNVRPGLDRATARFDRIIPPGGTGKVRWTMNTAGYQGKIRNSVTLYSNDPKSPVAKITVEALVQVPVTISSQSVYLKGAAGTSVTKGVSIQSRLNKPLRLDPVSFDIADKVAYRIETVEKGRLYWVHFTAVPGPRENYQGTLVLKTNYSEMPEIALQVRIRSR